MMLSVLLLPPVAATLPFVAALRYRGRDGQVVLELLLHACTALVALLAGLKAAVGLASMALEPRGFVMATALLLTGGTML